MHVPSNPPNHAPAREPPTRAAILGLFVAVAAAWLPVLLARDTIRTVAALAPLPESVHPYFVPESAGLLYAGAPLVAASAFVLFLSPGLFVSMAIGVRGGVARWILTGFGVSVVLVGAVTAGADALVDGTLRGGACTAVVAACALSAMGLVWIRHRAGGAVAWPFRRTGNRGDLLALIVPPLVLLAVMTPKLYWESFNGDGIHAFETARLLLVQPLPFWPPVVEDFASFPGVTSMLFAYPASWFVRVFGEIEAAVRLPYVLYLAVVYAALTEIVRHGRASADGDATRWLPWLGLGVYTIVMAYSATYDPYSADLAMPAAQDTLAVACFLGLVVGFLEREPGWMTLFAVLTIVSLPGGVLLLGLWMLAAALVLRPVPWRRAAAAGGVLAAGVAAAALAPAVLDAAGLPAPGAEYAGHALLGRLRYVQWADWTRLAWLVVPGGIVPALVLAAWRRLDRVGRALVLVTLAWFVLFYLQAFVALHHFVPAMVLPLCVFWRLYPTIDARRRRPLMVSTVAAAVLAAFVSLPETLAPDSSGRTIGRAIEDRTEGYESVDPAALARADVLLHLFPYDWDPAVPEEIYGGSPHVWHHYARRASGTGREVNYVMQAPSAPAPAGMRRVASEPGVALYLRSEQVWRRHRALRPPTPAGSRLYRIPRDVLFRRGADRPGVVDVKAWLER